jgi:cbb3-type cytochrome oxidase maturation protein
MIAESARLGEYGRTIPKQGIMESAMWTIFLLIFLSVVLGIGAWLFFLWAVKSGQYEDPERPKHRMLDDGDVPPKK